MTKGKSRKKEQKSGVQEQKVINQGCEVPYVTGQKAVDRPKGCVSPGKSKVEQDEKNPEEVNVNE